MISDVCRFIKEATYTNWEYSNLPQNLKDMIRSLESEFIKVCDEIEDWIQGEDWMQGERS